MIKHYSRGSVDQTKLCIGSSLSRFMIQDFLFFSVHQHHFCLRRSDVVYVFGSFLPLTIHLSYIFKHKCCWASQCLCPWCWKGSDFFTVSLCWMEVKSSWCFKTRLSCYTFTCRWTLLQFLNENKSH